jgi:hypothetical protein
MPDGEGDLQQGASLETEGFIVFFTGKSCQWITRYIFSSYT